MANINIYGELHNDTPNGYVAPASQIKDTNLDKLQSDLNAEFIGADRNTAFLICETTESEAIKIIDLPGYVISNNTRLLVKMLDKNTSGDTVKLKIGDSEAKNLLYNNSQVTDTNTWGVGEIVEVYYDNTIDKFCSYPSGVDSEFATGEKLNEVGINNDLAPDSDKLVTCRAIYDTIGDGLWKLETTDAIGSVVPAYKSIPVNLFAGVTYKIRATYQKLSEVTFQPYRKTSGISPVIIDLPSDVEFEFTPVVNLSTAEIVIGGVTDPLETITLSIKVDTVLSTIQKQVGSIQTEMNIITDFLFPLTANLEHDIEDNIIEYTGTQTTVNPVAANVTWTALKQGNPVIPSLVVLKRNGVEIKRWIDPEGNTDTFLDNILAYGRVNYNVNIVDKSNIKTTASTYFNIVLPCFAGFFAGGANLKTMKSTLIKRLVDQEHKNALDYTYINNSNDNYLTICVPQGISLQLASTTGFEVPMQSAIEDTSVIINNEEIHYKIYRSESRIKVTTMNLSCVLSFD